MNLQIKTGFVLAWLVFLSAIVTTATNADEALLSELRSSPHQVVFESYIDDNWELFVMNADGSGRRNLTNTPDVHELYPQASPDGTKISFLADVSRSNDTLRSVYYMNFDGSDRQLVAEKSRQQCWSGDGKRIAYLPQEFNRFRIADFASKGLRTFDLESGDTSDHPNKAINHLYTLNWSSNGRWFVSTIHGGMGYGHAILALGGVDDSVHDLKIAGCRPCLSADGTRVTWSLDDHTIMAADIDLAGNHPQVSNEVVIDKRDKLHLYHPDFSPDGKYITYSLGPGGKVRAAGPGTHTQVAEMVGVRGKWDIYLMPADGSGKPLRLTNDETLSNKESEWISNRKAVQRGGE
jgi:Tol biopolymer transport system component